MQSLTFWIAVISYAVATVFFFLGFGFGKERFATWGRWLAIGALAPHATALGLRWAEVGHGPYNTRYEVLSADVFLLVLVYVVAGFFAKGIRALGLFIMPIAFLGMGFGVATFELKSEVPIIFRSAWLWLHVGFAKLFAVCAAIATGAAAGYLVKKRDAGKLKWMPGVESLELYSHQFLLVSFLFLGVMIAAGSLWANQSWGRYWNWDPIETSALVTWIAFGVILHFRVLHKWTGARMAWLTFVAAAFMIVTIFVVAVAVPTVHNSYMVGRLTP
jgi:ABC-type transport system involved in cytochrome c biogenesis permease subunit